MNHKILKRLLVGLIAFVMLGSLLGKTPDFTQAAQGTEPIEPASYTCTAPNKELRVRAFIDGESWLIVHGPNVYWHHETFNPPGIPQENNYATILNGVEWKPSWNNCIGKNLTGELANCNSSTFWNAVPELPRISQQIPLVIDEKPAGGLIDVVYPIDPDYAFQIKFLDGRVSGAHWYEVRACYEDTKTNISDRIDVLPDSDGNVIDPNQKVLPVEIDGWVFAARSNEIFLNEIQAHTLPINLWISSIKFGVTGKEYSYSSSRGAFHKEGLNIGNLEWIFYFRMNELGIDCSQNPDPTLVMNIELSNGRRLEGQGQIHCTTP